MWVAGLLLAALWQDLLSPMLLTMAMSSLSCLGLVGSGLPGRPSPWCSSLAPDGAGASLLVERNRAANAGDFFTACWMNNKGAQQALSLSPPLILGCQRTCWRGFFPVLLFRYLATHLFPTVRCALSRLFMLAELATKAVASGFWC